MDGQAAIAQEALQVEISQAEALCRSALDSLAVSLRGIARLPSLQECHGLLRGCFFNRESAAILNSLAAEAGRDATCPRYAVERYVVLRACLVALPQLLARNLEGEIIRHFCVMVRGLASNGEDGRLDRNGDAFAELARIVTFRRLHAGQLSFDIQKPKVGVVLWWLLRAHPLDMPALLRTVVCDIGLSRPAVEPHLCYWREKPAYILRSEQERSLLQIAAVLERDPRIGGLAAWSWLYGAEVGRSFPHLAWIRAFFAAAGACIVDLGPASPDSGFLVGSRKRRELFAEGTFRPRETLVLWPRAELLAWARGQRQPDGPARQAPPPSKGLRADWRVRSGRYTLIDCSSFLFKSSIAYAALMIVVPALAAAVILSALWPATVAVAAFPVAFVVFWLFQYFFLQ